ncbi:carboxypeptidase-like regulatory domain-containing protein [Bacteroides ovatus]|uniref:energy transducer TonB n=1 Tax=Bacteroides ovatus TaxID=28116 RepID=UPI0024803576|nr:carboxypeptidase-like regulatory domain-containing protein [Bacteroides ovatus]MDC2383807.1 carboxypeptidase-like regulatory domain-containing protein [Bacteroides ovatus]
MKLLDYIRGLRKGKEAHRLEKESMQDPFLADAMDGYNQVEGNHEQRIEKLRMQVSAHSAKKKNTYAITWSIAACLIIGFGISSYFLFLKKSMTDEVFIAEESVSTKLAEPAAPLTPAIPATPTVPATPQKEIALATTKVKTDSTPVSEITARQANKKDMIAKIQATSQPQQGVLVATVPVMEEVSEETAALQEVVATMDTFESESDKKMKLAKVATILPQNNMIKGRVTNEKGEPLIGASVTYKGTNIGTITNMNGEFSLVKKDDKKRLTAQFIGYDPVEIRVDTSRTMLIAINENKQALNEVVVVGYGAKKNKKSVTAGTVVKGNEQANKDITPQPVIGKRKFQKYLKENLVRPTDEKCAQVKGKVVLTFLVNKEGRPFSIKVKESLCESSDKEAIRLIQEGPDWIYGTKLAEVTVHFE